MSTNETTEFKPVTRPAPHLMVTSEKLFTSPRNYFNNEFKDGHSIVMIEHHDRSTMTPEEIKTKTREYYYKLSLHWEIQYFSRVFVGVGQDCLYLFDLYSDYGIVFDTAVLINFDFSAMKNENAITKGIKDHTKIYNFYSNDKKYAENNLAHVNQYIPTKFPPAFSKRFALETAGVLTYDSYEFLYLQQDSPSQYKMIQDKFTVIGGSKD